jgi:cyanate permease
MIFADQGTSWPDALAMVALCAAACVITWLYRRNP